MDIAIVSLKLSNKTHLNNTRQLEIVPRPVYPFEIILKQIRSKTPNKSLRRSYLTTFNALTQDINLSKCIIYTGQGKCSNVIFAKLNVMIWKLKCYQTIK